MSTLSIELPESLQKQVQEWAEQEGISMEYFVALALAEKMASLRTVDYLRERAVRGSRQKFDAVLAKVPDVEPEEQDRL